jgi:predicted amidohydrolase
MRLSAIQYKPPKGRPETARLDIEELLGEAAQRGAHFAVLPEMATTGYIWDSPAEIAPHTEQARGPTAALLARLANQHKMWIICGFAERFIHPARKGPRGLPLATLYNSALVLNPNGELVNVYRKHLLYDLDKTWAQAGERRSRVPTDFGWMIPGICMDLNDDQFVSFLTERDAEIFAFCTNWVHEPGFSAHRYWHERLRPFRGWTIAANTWGREESVTFSGRSAIFNPQGEIVTDAPFEGDTVLVWDTEARRRLF